MIAGVLAVAALITAVGGAISAIIAAVAAIKGKQAAIEAKAVAVEVKDLVKQVIAIQQTNTQQQTNEFHFHGQTTVGNLTAPPKEITFPDAVAAIAETTPEPGLPAAQQAAPEERK